MNALIETLKESGQDYEFYPTTPEMLDVIIKRIFEKSENYEEWDCWSRTMYKGKRTLFEQVEKRYLDLVDILDIGAGDGAFKKAFKKGAMEAQKKYNREFSARFYAIEKSRILLERLMDAGYSIVGTDFDESTLVSKSADIVFCNPPYSVYENWTCRIISEIQADYIFLIIPERWKENKRITKLMKETRADVEILWKGDFLEGERAARAKVEILLIKRRLHTDELFDRWFEETFQPAQEVKEESSEEKSERLGQEMVQAESQIDYLVNSYNGELEKLVQNYRAICSLDSALLKEIGLKKEAIKGSFLEKINGLKKTYWNTVFAKLAPVTDRLTYKTRDKMRERFTAKQSVDFTAGNIYALLIYVCRKASDYYDEQITEFYKDLTEEENVKPYKSNQRVFGKEEHRWDHYRVYHYFDEGKLDPYMLDYRIVTRHSVFSGDKEEIIAKHQIHNLKAVATTMGFSIGVLSPTNRYGQKGYLYDGSDHVFCEFRIYKNGNTHLKLCREFVTALNVYVGRKFGWIKDKSDIVREFEPDQVPVAEKYFNFTPAITVNDTKLLN